MNTTENSPVDGNRLRLVLSTGRTGTTQFREFLKKTHKHLGIAFEPEPSRLAYLLWNAERSGFMFRNTALNMIRKSKHRMLADAAGKQSIVEFDSYLSPLICELLHDFENIHVVHMIRHPYTWITSIGNFKAASWRKHAVDFTPFTETVPPQVRDRWRQLNRFEQLAWAWRYVNEEILRLKPSCLKYQLVKFEDFVSERPETRIRTITGMLQILDPRFDGTGFDIDVNEKLNKSRDTRIPDWKNWPDSILQSVNAICSPLMDEFNYDAAP